MLLKTLCNLDSVSSNEDSVRKFVIDNIKPYADDIKIDVMGNVIALKKGEKHDKKVMVLAHMDEVGLIVSGITEKGFLEFKTVGGIDPRVLISKKVRIGDEKIPGVIGIKAIHLQEKSEREKVPKVKSLYIDIGAKDKEDAERKVSLGDFIAFDTEFEMLTDTIIKAKAIDDRTGIYVMLNLIKEKPNYDTYFCFTVQEETGLRGAKIVANKIEPDIAIVIESTTASDVFGVDEENYVTRVGFGPAISFADRRMIADNSYFDWMMSLAESENIKVQKKRAMAGGNDSGAVHLSNGGIKTISVSVPTRYIHSPVSVASLSDIQNAEKLLAAYLKRIGEFIG